MARFDRSSDGPSAYGPSPEPPEAPIGPDGAPDELTNPDSGWQAPSAPRAYPPVAPPVGPAADPGPPPPPPLGHPQPIAPWAPPPGAYSSTVAGVQGLQYGRTLDRVMAYLLDGFIVTIPVLIAGLLVAGGVLGGMGEGGLNLVVSIIGSGIHLLYFVSFWTGSARATLGMRLMKLQIGDARTGETLTVQAGLIRWLALGGAFQLLELVPPLLLLGGLLAFVWDLLLLATTAASPTKQGLHDRIAKTALVQPAGAQTPAVTCLVVIVALFALWVVGVVLVLLSTGFSGILSAVGTSI